MARTNRCKKVYVNANGEDLGRSATVDAAALEFRFYEDGDEAGSPSGEVLRMALSDISPDMQTCAAWHGIAQKVGDKFADAKRPDVEPHEFAAEQWEAITGGIWVAEGEKAGPRSTILLDAFLEAMVNGGRIKDVSSVEELTDDHKRNASAMLTVEGDDGKADPKATRERRKEIAAIPEVEAIMRRKEAERAAARAQKAAEKAQEASGGLDSLSL